MAQEQGSMSPCSSPAGSISIGTVIDRSALRHGLVLDQDLAAYRDGRRSALLRQSYYWRDMATSRAARRILSNAADCFD
jgi:hypothetical protein